MGLRRLRGPDHRRRSGRSDPGGTCSTTGSRAGSRAAEVARRVDRVIARVRAVPGDVACVAHGHVLRVFAARWIGLAPSVGRSLVLDPASLSELGWDREQPVIAVEPALTVPPGSREAWPHGAAVRRSAGALAQRRHPALGPGHHVGQVERVEVGAHVLARRRPTR